MHNNYKRPTTWGGNGRNFSPCASRSTSFYTLVLRDRHVADKALVNELASTYGHEEPEIRELVIQTRRGCLDAEQRQWACEALGLDGLPLKFSAPEVLRFLPKSPPVTAP
jgi:hypothetical protein